MEISQHAVDTEPPTPRAPAPVVALHYCYRSEAVLTCTCGSWLRGAGAGQPCCSWTVPSWSDPALPAWWPAWARPATSRQEKHHYNSARSWQRPTWLKRPAVSCYRLSESVMYMLKINSLVVNNVHSNEPVQYQPYKGQAFTNHNWNTQCKYMYVHTTWGQSPSAVPCCKGWSG